MFPLDKIFYIQLFVFLSFVLAPIIWLVVLYLQGKATFSLFAERHKPVGLRKIESLFYENSNEREAIENNNTAKKTHKIINLLDLTGKAKATPNSLTDESSDPRRKEIELEAMRLVVAYEKAQGRETEDVSMYYAGYDIKSFGDIFRAIEIKGKSSTGKIFLTPNEWNTAQKLGDSYFLYIVENISIGKPKLKIIQNPASKLAVSPSKIQYVLPQAIYFSNADEIIQLN